MSNSQSHVVFYFLLLFLFFILTQKNILDKSRVAIKETEFDSVNEHVEHIRISILKESRKKLPKTHPEQIILIPFEDM